MNAFVINRSILLLVGLLLFNLNTGLKASDSIPAKEKVLIDLYAKLDNRTQLSDQPQLILEISELWRNILQDNASFWYPFDSLTYVGKIYSPDSLLRIYTWNFPNPDGTHLYFGFIQQRIVPVGNILLFEFKHDLTSLSSIQNKVITSENWYGALYYDIIPVKIKNKTYYTLLGLDLNTFLTNRKIIDILFFENGEMKLGAPVFQLGKVIQHRVIFEYSSRAVMSLKYNKNRKMIIHDHLSPFQPRYKGQYQYYGPDFSYDGFIFENERWKQALDVNINNMQ